MHDQIDRAVGLVTQYNPLKVAPGALVRGNNCVSIRENIYEDRRGYALYAELGANVKQLLTYLDRVIVHNGDTLSYDDDGEGGFEDYLGSYHGPSGQKMRFVEASSNLFVTTSAGVKVFSDIAGTAARLAGAPRALDPDLALTNKSTGFLGDGNQCAYRIVIRRVDANENVILGYPSTRVVVYNTTANDEDVVLTVYLPDEVTVDDIVQVYRTEQVSGTTEDLSGDEMGLVYQVNPTATDISNGYLTFTDSIIDELRGAALYTSPSQEGIAQANDRPPLCRDIALYKDSLFYANTQTKQRLYVTLVSSDNLGYKTTGNTANGSNQVTNFGDTEGVKVGWKIEGAGIPAGTTITAISGTTLTLSQNATATATGAELSVFTNETIKLAGVTYSFGSSEIISGAGAPQIRVGVTGVAAADIDITARSIVRVVNRYAGNTSIYAFYQSGPDELPGQLLFEEVGLGGAEFTLQSTDADVSGEFFPAPPVDPAEDLKSTSTNSTQKNGLFFSKAKQNEAVPPLNFIPVGAANKRILRIAPLRDSLICIKEEGVYRVTGENAQSFVAIPMDLTVFCKAVDSVAVLQNSVYMLSNQGVVRITENSVEVVSRDIEPDLRKLLSFSNLSLYTTGCGYESDRHYLLSTMTESDDTAPTRTFVYNAFTNVWTVWDFGFNAAIVEPSADRLFFSRPDSPSVFRERKDFQDSDYADPEIDINILAIDGDRVTFTIASGTPKEGWVIEQDDTGIPILSLQINAGGFTATLDSDAPTSWTTGAAKIFPSVGMELEYHSWSGGKAAGLLKQVSEMAVLSDDTPGQNTATRLIMTFSSNFDEAQEEVDYRLQGGGWGSGGWGYIPWGGSSDSYGYRTYVPRNKQICTRLRPGIKHPNARERLVVAGLAFNFEMLSERIGR